MASQTHKIRVLVADDHATVRKGLQTFFEIVDNLTLVAEATSGPEALYLCYTYQPDVVLIALQTRGLDSVTVTRAICEHYGDIRVIVLVTSDDDKCMIKAVLEAGAVAALPKTISANELVRAIEVAYATKALH